VEQHKQQLSLRGCDFHLAADAIKESLRLCELEAKADGKEAYYDPKFLAVLYPFMDAPSEETALPLLRGAPYLEKCFKLCSPGGELYQSKQLLHSNVVPSAEQVLQLLAEHLVALSNTLAPKFASTLGSDRAVLFNDFHSQIEAEICALYLHLIVRTAKSRNKVGPWGFAPDALVGAVGAQLERKNTNARGGHLVNAFPVLCRDCDIELRQHVELLPAPGGGLAGTLFWEWGKKLGFKYQGYNPIALQVFVLAVIDGYIVLEKALKKG